MMGLGMMELIVLACVGALLIGGVVYMFSRGKD
jgi:hypothetical protein